MGRLGALGALALLLPAALPAQDAATRTALTRFRDSLAAVADTGRLRSLATQYDDIRATGEAGAQAAMRAGYAWLAIGRPTPATRAFRRAARLAPDWPLPWHALGAAREFAGRHAAANAANLGPRPGAGAFESAAEAYGEALDREPAHAEALADFARLALARRDSTLAAEALARFDRVPAHELTATLALLKGRLEWRLGRLDAAYSTFGLAEADDPDGAAHYERARVTLALGRASGSEDYWAASATARGSALGLVRRDLALIATPGELAAWDSAPDRTGFLHAFWNDRDARDLRAPGERLREHFRRVAEAEQRFLLGDTRRAAWLQDAIDAIDSILDDRGVVYVRQGDPDLRLTPYVFGFAPNETWRYRRPDGDLLLHFGAQHSVDDYRLVESVEDITQTGGTDMGMMFLSRTPAAAEYSKVLVWGPFGRSNMLERLRDVGAASIAVGTSTDSHPLRFAAPLEAWVTPLAIGAAPGGTEVQVMYGVVLSGMNTIDTVRVRFSALDSLGHAVAMLDTTDLVRRSAARGVLIGRVVTRVPAGEWRWRAAVQTGDSAGSLLPGAKLTTRRHDGAELAVSDLALGTIGRSVLWRPTPVDSALLSPFDAVRLDRPVELYYEVYGVPETAEYQTIIRLRRGGKREQPRLTLSFEDVAHAAIVRAHRTLDLEAVSPGDYALEVEVRVGPPGAGVWALSTRTLTVLGN
jgi:GWxTD domain-containing protein